MNKVMQFNASISNVQKLNPLFSKCDIRVMYEGANRNNSFISRQTVEDAKYSIYNIPIVGEWKETATDFGGHGGKIEISDDGIKFVQTTKPYGVVPSDAKVFWQPIAEADGTVREYLIIQGAYLWTGRYPEATDMMNNAKGQSMEIEVLDGHIDSSNLFVISDMVFSALCILGENVEPCFESANIKAYNFNKDEFKQEFTAMMSELKASLNEDVENNGKEVEGVNEAEKEFAADVNPGEVEQEQEQEVFEAESEAENKAESASEEVFKEEAADAEKETEEEFDGEADEDQEDDFGKKKKKMELEAELTSKIESLESELATLQAKYQAVVAERDELFAYKDQAEKQSHEAAAEELFVQFDKLDEEEIQQVRAVMFDLSLEQIEEKLYFMLGKKVAKFSTNAKKTETVKVGFSQAKEKEDKDGYELSHLFQKYSDQ